MCLRIQPFRIRDHSAAPPALIRTKPKRRLDVSNLANRHPRVVASTFDPKQVWVIAYMSKSRTPLALPIESDLVFGGNRPLAALTVAAGDARR